MLHETYPTHPFQSGFNRKQSRQKTSCSLADALHPIYISINYEYDISILRKEMFVLL
jgi:hypothetical protein